MNYLKAFIAHVRNKPSIYFFVVIVIFSIDSHHRLEHALGPIPPIASDVQEYYSFLPDIFLDHTEAAEQRIVHNRRTLGMAVMYAPAFAVGHFVAALNDETTDGYSESYRWALRWGSIIYVLLGLLFLRSALLFYFREVVVTITLIGIFLGTNLYYYTYGWGEMPHGYLFFLYALYAWLTIRCFKLEKYRSLVWIALIAGIIAWIRPTGIVVLLFPVLYGVTSWNDLKLRFVLFVEHKRSIVFSVLLFLFPLVLQMLFWKTHTGNWVKYTYGNEGFFFGDPQIVNFLFSFRKGWLVYTPIMIFAVVGLFLSRRRLPHFFIFSILFLAINVYVLSSWWEWSFGGSFGCRALIETYAFLAFPFAVTIDWIWFNRLKALPKSVIRISALILLLVLIRFNAWQTYLYRAGVIHWSGMNKETYMYILVRDEFTEADYGYLNSKFFTPDPKQMLNGDRDK